MGTMTTQGTVPKSSYTFLKLQLVAVCCLAFWLFVSPPKLDYLKHTFSSQPARTPLISSTSNIDRGSRLFQSSLHRPGGTTRDGLPETSPSSRSDDVAEVLLTGKDHTVKPTPTLSQENITNTIVEIEPAEEPQHTWMIKWQDRDFSKTKKLPITEGYTWNNTREEVKRHVIFNRVGKCGSRSVLNLLQSLAKNNHFYLISSQVYNDKRISSENQEKLVSILSKVQSPFIYQRHLHFINFTEYGFQHPTYINIIRDPLERAVSQYYFIRFGDEKKQERRFSQNSTDPRKLMSYEQCVIQQVPECIGKRAFYIVPFFCGHDPRCRFPTAWALERAIENVKKHYVAVGILEELQDSLQVFQKVLPDMFSGALDTFLRFEQIANRNKTSVGVTQYKKKPSAKTALYVQNVLMKYEYQFYNWIKNRMHQQMADLGIKSYHKSYR
eukprot:XP_794450.3 PREDICTED: uronyl 2-sulfotransferase [Strongylocentrotus purpuratus]